MSQFFFPHRHIPTDNQPIALVGDGWLRACDLFGVHRSQPRRVLEIIKVLWDILPSNVLRRFTKLRQNRDLKTFIDILQTNKHKPGLLNRVLEPAGRATVAFGGKVLTAAPLLLTFRQPPANKVVTIPPRDCGTDGERGGRRRFISLALIQIKVEESFMEREEKASFSIVVMSPPILKAATLYAENALERCSL
ncbi:hypothetical protein K435DRAFT_799427 [Dendrothele bispora CBS 962.96]|uniref:Uncharacterized protein n=1 Tax=Dendrothele bispora (strain CBS 962.96) TaxID=1314807 RepID=A0A4S8LX35_DENBC|nr:hypothetical protein K435DRAFT_799427 [Dendrothele bispora CBS 962.96]